MTFFIGGSSGDWEVIQMASVKGESLPTASRLSILEDAGIFPLGRAWTLRGAKSNIRYSERVELSELKTRQEKLGRLGSTLAALIPISKSQEWWDLSQDERRLIFEARSRHISGSLKYLP